MTDMRRYDNPNKVYVAVTALFDPEGRMRPLSIVWPDGRRFDIDRVIDVRRQASQKAGGTGIRYLCCIQGKEAPIFFEDPAWFMERKD